MNKFVYTIRRNMLDCILLVILFCCIFLMFASSSDPLLTVLNGTFAESVFAQFRTGNQIISNLSVGIISSILMFFLVVRIPEHSKRMRVRHNLQRTYDTFKEECISIFLDAVEDPYNMELIIDLKDQQRFRDYFDGQYSSDQIRWDAVANGITGSNMKRILNALEGFLYEVDFTVNALDITDQDVFKLFKELKYIVYRCKNLETDYDDEKSLLSVMWRMFTGYSSIDGYTGKDLLAEMMAKL